MHNHPLHAGHELTVSPQRVRALGQTTARLQALRDQVTNDLATKQEEIEGLTARVELLAKVGELLRALMDKLVLDQVQSIQAVVSEGLKTIFFDQGLAFEAEVTSKYNKVSIDFYLKQGEDERAIRGHPLESFGGGPTSIASLILRLLALMRLKKAPILLLDETLAAVSDDYIDAAGQFLSRLAQTTGIDILLVTHKQGFLDHATASYQAHVELEDDEESGAWSLGLRRLRGSK